MKGTGLLVVLLCLGVLFGFALGFPSFRHYRNQRSAALQTLCDKYAIRFYGANTVDTERQFVQSIVNNTFAKLTVHPLAKNWFNGINNDGSDFIGQADIQASFLSHLWGFFGNALGCSFLQQFPAEDLNFDPDMGKMHGVGPDRNNFNKPISKEAFEIHNQVVCDFLYSLGVDTVDIITVAEFLDSFRVGLGNFTQYICQDVGCTSSPYSVYVRDNFFLPPYMTVPPGNTVTFLPASTHEHTVTSSPAESDCHTTTSYDHYMSGFFASPITIKYDKEGLYPYKCNFHCYNGMYALINTTKIANEIPTQSSSPSSAPSSRSSPLKDLI